MNIKSFLVAALSSALDLGMATCDDVIRHVTPDLLAKHLPRPLWARLLTACVGAPRVDAQLVVETIGVPNLCEHVPSTVMWACLAEIGARSLGTYVPTAVSTTPMMATPTPVSAPLPPAPVAARPTIVPLTMTPPPEVIVPPTATQQMPTVAMGPDIPPPVSLAAELFGEDDRSTAAPSRARTPTQQRFLKSSTGIGRLASARRPQAAAPANPLDPETERPRRHAAATESDYDISTDVSSGSGRNDDWKANLAVEDEQLVDWAASEETVNRDPDDVGGRKR